MVQKPNTLNSKIYQPATTIKKNNKNKQIISRATGLRNATGELRDR